MQQHPQYAMRDEDIDFNSPKVIGERMMRLWREHEAAGFVIKDVVIREPRNTLEHNKGRMRVVLGEDASENILAVDEEHLPRFYKSDYAQYVMAKHRAAAYAQSSAVSGPAFQNAASAPTNLPGVAANWPHPRGSAPGAQLTSLAPSEVTGVNTDHGQSAIPTRINQYAAATPSDAWTANTGQGQATMPVFFEQNQPAVPPRPTKTPRARKVQMPRPKHAKTRRQGPGPKHEIRKNLLKFIRDHPGCLLHEVYAYFAKLFPTLNDHKKTVASEINRQKGKGNIDKDDQGRHFINKSFDLSELDD